MGSGIAQVMAIAGHEVVCRDLNMEVLNVARTAVDSGRFGVRGAVERGKLSNEQAEAALKRLTFTTDLETAVNADVIIEAIPEDLALKIRFGENSTRWLPATRFSPAIPRGFLLLL